MQRNQHRPLRFIALFFCGVILASCQTLSENTIAETTPLLPSPHDSSQAYRIGSGDVLNIKFFHYPELNEKLPVPPDGRITMQLVGEVQVAGHTAAELRKELERRYAEHLKHPAVSVNVIDFQSQKVYVGGEVGTPAMLPLNPGLTARQALIMAGGARNTGALDSVLLIRDGGDGKPRAYRIDLVAGLASSPREGGDSGPLLPGSVPLQPRDVLYVPRSSIASVNLFVEQYLSRIVPSWILFQATYNTGTLRTD